MRFIGDFHIHSSYSRATGKEMMPRDIWQWAQLKGITVMGTGDFTHPAWFKELTHTLEPVGNGLFTLREEFETDQVPGKCRAPVYFLLSVEISCIYSKNGRTRKVHCIVFMPDFESVARFSAALSGIGNLKSDGRPILGLDAKKLLKITLETTPDAMLIPAHAWTPHFSVFGAASGFDSMEECFEDLTPHIYAIETGLSSDPAMNWRISALDHLTLISNSDAHSAPKIGREANIFDADISYRGITEAIKTKKGFLGTIEFFPEEGKYHHDGHRSCNVSFSPEETMRHGGLCPVCNRKVTVGVMHRVSKLADRGPGFRPDDAPGFRNVIPLPEVIGEAFRVGAKSKTVQNEYFRLLEGLGNEFAILLDVAIADIAAAASPIIGEAVACMRAGKVNIAPGYDGEFGKIRIFEEMERTKAK